jgi:hypothetical protein
VTDGVLLVDGVLNPGHCFAQFFEVLRQRAEVDGLRLVNPRAAGVDIVTGAADGALKSVVDGVHRSRPVLGRRLPQQMSRGENGTADHTLREDR